jgi:hypothetical protein
MNIVHTIKRRKANWIGHILRRNCLLKHVIEGKLAGRIEMTGRRRRRRKQLLDDLKEKRRYWKLKEEALDRTLWRTRFGRGYGPVVRQTAESGKKYFGDVEGVVAMIIKWVLKQSVRMRSSFFLDVTGRRLLTDVSGQLIGPTSKGHSFWIA